MPRRRLLRPCHPLTLLELVLLRLGRDLCGHRLRRRQLPRRRPEASEGAGTGAEGRLERGVVVPEILVVVPGLRGGVPIVPAVVRRVLAVALLAVPVGVRAGGGGGGGVAVQVAVEALQA